MKRNDFIEVLATIFAVCMAIGLIITIWCGLLSGEKTEVSAAGTDSLQCFTIRSDKSEYVRIWTDPDTGVQYLLYTAVGRGGICPRYNTDGSLMIEGDLNEKEGN